MRVRKAELKNRFRFQTMDIWRDAMALSDQLFDLADHLEGEKKFRFAEQLRGSAMSVTNNIAEGSGSESKKDFSNYLNIAKRSVFETVNILIILNRRGFLNENRTDDLLEAFDSLSRRITGFRRYLLK